ncbi:MAG: histidinol-phosphatase HisJ family protein [Candidatus Aenigmatarchaeota archaeon]
MIIDYHIHTEFSDGKGIFEDYINQAMKKKIDEIGFSDHFNFKNPKWSMKIENIDVYLSRILKLKSENELSIKAGIEMDFNPEKIKQTIQFLKKYKFDYVIGSIHYIKNWCIDDEMELGKWKQKDIDGVYKKYYNLVQQMAKTKIFDIVGHLDVVKKFNLKPKKDISDILDETIQTISESKMCIEINTSGLRKPCKETYPEEKIVKMCFEKGIKITLGSDSHMPDELSADFDKTIKMLKNIGYEKIVIFKNRKPKEIELG